MNTPAAPRVQLVGFTTTPLPRYPPSRPAQYQAGLRKSSQMLFLMASTLSVVPHGMLRPTTCIASATRMPPDTL